MSPTLPATIQARLRRSRISSLNESHPMVRRFRIVSRLSSRITIGATLDSSGCESRLNGFFKKIGNYLDDRLHGRNQIIKYLTPAGFLLWRVKYQDPRSDPTPPWSLNVEPLNFELPRGIRLMLLVNCCILSPELPSDRSMYKVQDLTPRLSRGS